MTPVYHRFTNGGVGACWEWLALQKGGGLDAPGRSNLDSGNEAERDGGGLDAPCWPDPYSAMFRVDRGVPNPAHFSLRSIPGSSRTEWIECTRSPPWVFRDFRGCFFHGPVSRFFVYALVSPSMSLAHYCIFVNPLLNH